MLNFPTKSVTSKNFSTVKDWRKVSTEHLHDIGAKESNVDVI